MCDGDGGCPSVKGQLVNSCLKTSQLTLGSNRAGTDEAFAESKLVIGKPFADIGRGYLKHLSFEGPNIELLYLSKHSEIGVDLSLLSQFAGLQKVQMDNSNGTRLRTVHRHVLLCKKMNEVCAIDYSVLFLSHE